MSLDVYLKLPEGYSIELSGIPYRQDGRNIMTNKEEWKEKYPDEEPIELGMSLTKECYSANITHNLAPMAKEADLYKFLWRPDEIGIKKAKQLIKPLQIGLALLKSNPARFKEFNPPNGWGNYEILVEFVEEYLAACKEYPKAEVSVWR